MQAGRNDWRRCGFRRFFGALAGFRWRKSAQCGDSGRRCPGRCGASSNQGWRNYNDRAGDIGDPLIYREAAEPVLTDATYAIPRLGNQPEHVGGLQFQAARNPGRREVNINPSADALVVGRILFGGAGDEEIEALSVGMARG